MCGPRDSDTIAVQRGVNGTTAAAIAQNAPIDICEYPPPVSEAALLLAVRLWHGARGGVDDWQASEIGMDADIGFLLGRIPPAPLWVSSDVSRIAILMR